MVISDVDEQQCDLGRVNSLGSRYLPTDADKTGLSPPLSITDSIHFHALASRENGLFPNEPGARRLLCRMLLVPYGPIVLRWGNESVLDIGTRNLRAPGEDGPHGPLDQLCNGIWAHRRWGVVSRASVVKGDLLLPPEWVRQLT